MNIKNRRIICDIMLVSIEKREEHKSFNRSVSSKR